MMHEESDCPLHVALSHSIVLYLLCDFPVFVLSFFGCASLKGCKVIYLDGNNISFDGNFL